MNVGIQGAVSIWREEEDLFIQNLCRRSRPGDGQDNIDAQDDDDETNSASITAIVNLTAAAQCFELWLSRADRCVVW